MYKAGMRRVKYGRDYLSRNIITFEGKDEVKFDDF